MAPSERWICLLLKFEIKFFIIWKLSNQLENSFTLSLQSTWPSAKKKLFKKCNMVAPHIGQQVLLRSLGVRGLCGQYGASCIAFFKFFSSLGGQAGPKYYVKKLMDKFLNDFNEFENSISVGRSSSWPKAARPGVDARRVRAPAACVLHAIVLWLYE